MSSDAHAQPDDLQLDDGDTTDVPSPRELLGHDAGGRRNRRRREASFAAVLGMSLVMHTVVLAAAAFGVYRAARAHAPQLLVATGAGATTAGTGDFTNADTALPLAPFALPAVVAEVEADAPDAEPITANFPEARDDSADPN